MMRQKGFTLIEVIIAMLILSFLSLFTVQSIQRALQTKTKVQKDIDKNSTVRDALRIMERDINMAFNYRDINIELWNQAQKTRRENAQKGTAGVVTASGTGGGTGGTGGGTGGTGAAGSKPYNEADPEWAMKTEKVVTQFIGDPQSLDFTSLSNVRMMEESAISQQAEIGYKLKPCRRRSNQEQSSNCLWRRVANYIHEDITKNGQETVLLENVTEFKLRYLGPGRDGEWVDTWITNDRGDDQTKNKFPYAVEITLEVKDSDPKAKDKALRLTTVAALRNPNNKKEEPPKEGQPGALPLPPPTP